MMTPAIDAAGSDELPTVGDDCGACGSEAARRGRPRTAGIEAAVLEATLDMASEVGFRGFSMDDLAQRAGVSKATIYRRWDSKESLVLAALHGAIRPLDEVDQGGVAADLEAFLADLGGRMKSGQVSDILPHLIDVAVHDELLRASLDEYVASRRRPVLEILERGRARGEVRVDVDLDVVVDTLVGPFIYRKLLTYANFGDDFVERLLAVVLPGVLTTPS